MSEEKLKWRRDERTRRGFFLLEGDLRFQELVTSGEDSKVRHRCQHEVRSVVGVNVEHESTY